MKHVKVGGRIELTNVKTIPVFQVEDFALQGHAKELVYETRMECEIDLVVRIRAEVGTKLGLGTSEQKLVSCFITWLLIQQEFLKITSMSDRN